MDKVTHEMMRKMYEQQARENAEKEVQDNAEFRAAIQRGWDAQAEDGRAMHAVRAANHAADARDAETKAEHLQRYKRATRAHVVSCDICYGHKYGTKAPGCK